MITRGRLFRNFSLQCLPATSQDELRENILPMARCEFLLKPMAILSYMRSGLTDLVSLKTSLPVQKISELYQVLSPTCANVLKNVRAECEDLRPEEEREYKFLTVYIGVWMVTSCLSSFTLWQGPHELLSVRVYHGLSRTPHASTCNNTLTISTTHETYFEFMNDSISS